MGMHNKGTCTRVCQYAYTRIDIRVYAKYERIIRVCVVRIYLSCTVADDSQQLNSKGFIKIFSSRVTDFTGFHMPGKLFEQKNLPARQLNQVFRIFLTVGQLVQ